MTEILFYHLQQQPLEKVLPALLEKTLERGWKAVIRTGSEERLDVLDEILWTYRDDSFLPHGKSGDGQPARQPIYLTTKIERPNAAEVLFVVDAAPLGEIGDAPYLRIVLLFDGNDPDQTALARSEWKAIQSGGLTATYWQQNDQGRWEKRA